MSEQSQNKKKLNTVLIGNPGVGKSTFLNAFLEVVKFKTGIAIGKGLTSICQKETDTNGNTYIDTPGLSDISLRKQAAEEIRKALQSGGFFKIFFVITLEEGRLRPDDKTTMKLVLDAAPIDSMYSIIINKLQPEIIEILKDDAKKGELIALLNDDLPGTFSVYFNPYDSNLSAKENVLSVLTPNFYEFILNAPMLIIEPENVKEIQSDNFEAIKAVLMKQIAILREDTNKMQKAMASEKERYEKMIDKIAKNNENLEKQYSKDLHELRDKFSTQMKALKKEAEKKKSSGSGLIIGGIGGLLDTASDLLTVFTKFAKFL